MFFWQDAVITAIGIIFSLSLIPQIYYGFKEKVGAIHLQTSVPTFLGLYVMAFTYITLSLYYSAIMAFFTGTLWLTLFIQRLIYRNIKN
jgi:hypothetical protein